jgi:hypothetical protein
MTTELVILLTIVVAVIVGIFKTPAQSLDESGPRLGMRLEKQIETGSGFRNLSQSGPYPIVWAKKN